MNTSMKNFKISRTRNFRNSKTFNPKAVANRIMLQSEFDEGKNARVKYKNGKLIIAIGKKNKQLQND